MGVDRRTRFVDNATRLAAGESLHYGRTDQGERRSDLSAHTPPGANTGSVEFVVADAHELPESLGTFDAVLLANLLDRLTDPEACLRQFTDSEVFLRSGGLLLVASPWTWLPEHTEPDRWLGAQEPSATSSESALRQLLAGAFDLLDEADEPGVLRDHARHFEYFDADVTIWCKR